MPTEFDEIVTKGTVSRTVSRPRVPALDGLRGIAILMVVLFHVDQIFFANRQGPTERLYHGVAQFGWSGVDLFFVLSGFLITGILADAAKQPGSFRIFYLRRTFRIFPLYFAFLVAFFGVVPFLLSVAGQSAAVRDQIRPSTQIYAWLYLANWVSGPVFINYFSPLIAHIWSLSVEEQFYIIWPVVVRRLRHARLKHLCGLLVVFSLLSRLALHALGFPGSAYTWTICRVDGLAVGALLALCMRNPFEWEVLGRAARLAVPGCAVMFATLGKFSLRSTLGDNTLGVAGDTVLVVLFGSCLVFAVSPKGNWIRSICSVRFLRESGQYSYGAYVLHMPVLYLAQKCGLSVDAILPLVHRRGLALLVILAVSLMLTAIASLASWHLLEKRFLRVKEDLTDRLRVRASKGPAFLLISGR